ncbi:MAG: hypothetical protein J7K96_04700 [Desulfobacteraceae bacterium]|nr:hypothetical protein [Desulfobacteraceae bacterium]
MRNNLVVGSAAYGSCRAGKKGVNTLTTYKKEFPGDNGAGRELPLCNWF